jgi:hypothetical protein
MMETEWDNLPYESGMRLPITANVPNFFRWKILQVKLMLADLDTLSEKYSITAAENLKHIIEEEAEQLCKKLADMIIEKQRRRQGLVKKG